MLIQNIRYALRLVRQSPGFTALAVGTLALGIGANTAVFSVVDAVMLRPLPYAEPDRLVSLSEHVQGQDRMSVALGNLPDYDQGSATFAGLAGYMLVSRSLTRSGPPEDVPAEAVTWNYFQVLGVQPEIGRAFAPADDAPGAALVVMISNDLWRARFSGDPAIIGHDIVLDGEPHTVIGVAPASFEPLARFGVPQPARLFITGAFPPQLVASRGNSLARVVGRLKPGVTLEQAQARLDAVSHGLSSQYPDTNRDVRPVIASLPSDLVRGVRGSILLLLGAAALVLLVACVNVANLLLVRAISQRHELAMRLALGATRRQIVLELLMRGLVLATVGGAAGLLCAVWIRDLLVSVAPATIPRLQNIGLNVRILGVTTAVSLLSGLIAGLLPALHMSKYCAPTLKETGMTASETRSVLRWRGVLMAGEVAAAVVLAVGAGLLIRSLVVLNGVSLGFTPRQILVASVNLPRGTYPDGPSHTKFFDDLLTRVAQLPGVESAAYANLFPLRGGWGGDIRIEGVAETIDQTVGLQAVGGRYFDTLGLPLVSGRLLEETDGSGAPLVAVVNQAFSRRFLSGSDPIGRRFRRSRTGAPITVVGLVGDIRREGQLQPMTPQVYLPSAQNSSAIGWPGEVAVRSSLDAGHLVRAVQQQVRDIDPEQPVSNVAMLDKTLSASVADRTFTMMLLSSFAALALVLALVGCYGVVSYAAAQRTREIGIRVAFGAARNDIIAMIVKGGMWWSVAGVAAGVAGALALTRVLRGLLFEVTPTDPWTFGGVIVAMLLVALVASYLPARRAAGVAPSAALRVE